MKYYFLIIILSFPLIIKAQDKIHFLRNKDSITDCSFIKSGKFVDVIMENWTTKGYSVEFRDGFSVDKAEDGKYFLKSKITYTSECKYEKKVLETNIPGYKELVGKTFFIEILGTCVAEKLILIRSREVEKWTTEVLRKIED